MSVFGIDPIIDQHEPAKPSNSEEIVLIPQRRA